MINWIKLTRIYQWAKNLLIFLPLIFSHQFDNFEYISICVIGFFAFSFCASAVYIINDLLDLNFDKKHPYKKHRPLASNKISQRSAKISCIFLIIISFILANLISINTIFLLCVYLIFSFLYSKYFKKIKFLDILILTSFYIFRIYFGGTILEIDLSLWLIVFSISLFMSLGFLKRFSELEIHKKLSILKNFTRNYSYNNDVKKLNFIGLFFGYFAAILIVPYSQSQTAKNVYSHPDLIIFSSLIICFWIYRIWKKAKLINMNDPVEFALKDKLTYVALFLILITFVLSK